MTNLKSQSGRSMVEMLGVLAIIGVLSIGGIAGYTMAMNRFRANEILNYASQVAVMAQTKNAGQGGKADLSDLNLEADDAQGVTIEANRFGHVKLTNVPENVVTAINNIVGKDICTGTTCEYDPATRESQTFVAEPTTETEEDENP